MQLQDKYRIALLSAYAIGLHGFEGLLPTPVPWLRLGLANIVTLIALLFYGVRPALMITLIRVTVVSIFSGTFLGPAFILSLGGGLISTIAMGLALSLAPGLFSAVGLSIIGAFFHNITQLVLAYFLFIQNIGAMLLITPLILFLGTLTGSVNGIISGMLVRGLKNARQNIQNVS